MGWPALGGARAALQIQTGFSGLFFIFLEVEMGILDKLNNTVTQGVGGAFGQGLLGNLSEQTPETLTKEFGMYLMEGESIHMGFKLIRDVVIFTDRRIIDIDKQGATGKKTRIDTIYLSSIINVSCETAGFGLDDSEINVHYITSPYFKATAGVSISERTFDFPKKYNMQPLYTYLAGIAYSNFQTINK